MTRIKSALISVFYKDGLEPLVRELHNQDIKIYSTGGTQNFIENLGIGVTPVEELTSYPSILGGRVKTLHPSVFGGILGRRSLESDVKEMEEYGIPSIDLVIVDLYPFEETVAQTTDESLIIEKIDIGGPSMIRAAAKNFKDVAVVASKDDYSSLVQMLIAGSGALTLEQRKAFAARAFSIVAQYDNAIDNWFNGEKPSSPLRYGENPHQTARFYGSMEENFIQYHGKEISYNNLVDIDAAIDLISEFEGGTFAIIKHTNVCGIASRETVSEAWDAALAGDPESAFGGVLVSNMKIDLATAQKINEIFFEVILAPHFEEEALQLLKTKKNRIILKLNNVKTSSMMVKTVLNGRLEQEKDKGNFDKWEVTGTLNEIQKQDLIFANIVCKHLKSNAIALVKNKQLVGKGCGQTSRIDALRQAVEKSKQFNFSLSEAVMASDAFFPFDDCVKLGHQQGINAYIQPGGSIRDKDSIEYCQAHGLTMVLTGMRHFKH